MTDEWWEAMTAPELAGTPIGELVDGLDEIGASAIPYGRLPGRARTSCSEDFDLVGPRRSDHFLLDQSAKGRSGDRAGCRGGGQRRRRDG
jgi:hypothetical protein